MCPAPVECRPDRSDARRFGATRSRTPAPDELQLEPDQLPVPARPAPLLRRYIPGLQKGMEKLPAFIRDTDLNLHFRTFYFDR